MKRMKSNRLFHLNHKVEVLYGPGNPTIEPKILNFALVKLADQKKNLNAKGDEPQQNLYVSRG